MRKFLFWCGIQCVVILVTGSLFAFTEQQESRQHQAASDSSSSKPRTYESKSEILSLKGEILGGEFRVTDVIPLKGDFSKYRHIEIARLQSLIGNAVDAKLLEENSRRMVKEFEQVGLYESVSLIEDYEVQSPDPAPVTDSWLVANGEEVSDQFVDSLREPEPLQAPMLSLEDMKRIDRERAARVEREEKSGTLVIVGKVLDYDNGNRWLQLFPLNLGTAVFTTRFHYYDKETGMEIGRQIVTSEVSTGNVLAPLRLRSVLTAVLEGASNRIMSRTVAAEW